MNVKGLIKKAHIAIKQLYEENTSLKEEVSSLRSDMEKISKAKELTFKLLKQGAFPIEDFEEHFNNFNEKTAEELETFEKASELIKKGNLDMGIGKLSEDFQSTYSPEDRFIHSLIED